MSVLERTSLLFPRPQQSTSFSTWHHPAQHITDKYLLYLQQLLGLEFGRRQIAYIYRVFFFFFKLFESWQKLKFHFAHS